MAKLPTRSWIRWLCRSQRSLHSVCQCPGISSFYFFPNGRVGGAALVALFTDGKTAKVALLRDVFDRMVGSTKAYTITFFPFAKSLTLERNGAVTFAAVICRARRLVNGERHFSPSSRGLPAPSRSVRAGSCSLERLCRRTRRDAARASQETGCGAVTRRVSCTNGEKKSREQWAGAKLALNVNCMDPRLTSAQPEQ